MSLSDLIPNRTEAKQRPLTEAADLGVLVIETVLTDAEYNDQQQRHADDDKTEEQKRLDGSEHIGFQAWTAPVSQASAGSFSIWNSYFFLTEHE